MTDTPRLRPLDAVQIDIDGKRFNIGPVDIAELDGLIRAVAAAAWDDGYAHGTEEAPCYDFAEPTPNPFRAEAG